MAMIFVYGTPRPRPAVLAATSDLQVDGTIVAINGVMTNGPGTTAGWNASLVPVTPGTGAKVLGGAVVLSAGTPSSLGSVLVSGTVSADSGPTGDCVIGGSGGGIRLVATNKVEVTGTLSAKPGSRAGSVGGFLCCGKAVAPAFGGSVGRIRLEAPIVTATGSVTPPASESAVLLPPPWM